MSAPDPLGEIAARLDAAQAAAERLAAQAAAARAEARADAGGGAAGDGIAGAELQALLGLLDAARAVVPEELWERLTELARALLLAVRALLDASLARLDGERAGASAPTVEDVPVE